MRQHYNTTGSWLNKKNGHPQKGFIVHAGLCMTKEYVLFALFSVGFA